MSREAQTSNTVLMVRPASFGFNAETAGSNAFASAMADPEIRHKALAEFNALADTLTAAGVEVLVLEDTTSPLKPDAAFPNNWASFHADGTIVLYPMAAPSRRFERRVEDVRSLLRDKGFAISNVIDLSPNEDAGRFLEGTGSLILDRPGRRAFAAVGPRTDRGLLDEFDAAMGYTTHIFHAFDRAERPIYHTNVMLSLGTGFAVICLDVVPEHQRAALTATIEVSGREVIAVGYEQMAAFACNIIELKGNSGEPLVALSSSALTAFDPRQRRRLESFAGLVSAPIPTIEQVGGGSVRCMIADVHLPRS